MKKRSQINNKYKWDTTHIYSDEKLLDKDIDYIKNQIDVIKSFKGKLNNKKNILEYFKHGETLSSIMDKVSVYIYLNRSENIGNQKYVEYMGKIENIGTQMSVASSFEESELLSNGVNFLKNLANDVDFKDYRLELLDLVRNAPHVLNENEEKIVSQTSNFAGGYSDVFDNIDALDVKFKDIEVNGKKYKVNNSEYHLLLENKNSEVREKAFKSLFGGYMSLANTIATNYISSVKADDFYSKVYNFDSRLQVSMFSNNLPTEIYTNLIMSVNNNVKLLHEYLRLRKRFLGLKTLKYSDLAVSLVNYSEKYTYEKMCETMYEALAPLGEEYLEVVKYAVNNRWIDVYPTEGKETGGYSIGLHSVHPYILLNTVDNQNSMFTLVHEMGHTMHSYLSSKHQPYSTHDYPIFLAEIASTTNEVLLIKYLFSKAKSKKEKVYLLDKYLSMFRTTLFRQTMFAEFEHFAHVKVENNEPISKDILTKEYDRLNKVYHGNAIKPCKEIGYEWLRIPHFYRSYYVYKYATGITSAICIANRILNGENIEGYLNFLSSGGCDYPHEILKNINVDLTTQEPYNVAFKEMKWALSELKKLV